MNLNKNILLPLGQCFFSFLRVSVTVLHSNGIWIEYVCSDTRYGKIMLVSEIGVKMTYLLDDLLI